LKRKKEDSDDERNKSVVSFKKVRTLTSQNTDRIDSTLDLAQDGFAATSIKIPVNLNISEILYTIHNANNFRNVRPASSLFNTDRLNEFNAEKERIFSEFANQYISNSNTSKNMEISNISTEFEELLKAVDNIRKQKFKVK